MHLRLVRKKDFLTIHSSICISPFNGISRGELLNLYWMSHCPRMFKVGSREVKFAQHHFFVFTVADINSENESLGRGASVSNTGFVRSNIPPFCIHEIFVQGTTYWQATPVIMQGTHQICLFSDTIIPAAIINFQVGQGIPVRWLFDQESESNYTNDHLVRLWNCYITMCVKR